MNSRKCRWACPVRKSSRFSVSDVLSEIAAKICGGEMMLTIAARMMVAALRRNAMNIFLARGESAILKTDESSQNTTISLNERWSAISEPQMTEMGRSRPSVRISEFCS